MSQADCRTALNRNRYITIVGRPKNLVPKFRGVDYVHLDIDRGVRGIINTPAFTLDGLRLVAPTLWCMGISCPRTRTKSAGKLRDFLNEYLNGMEEEERENIDPQFWQEIDRDTVQGYFYDELHKERGLEKTSILNIRAALKSFYETAGPLEKGKGWTARYLSILFDNMADIEEPTELDLRSQYIEKDLFKTIGKQILNSHKRVDRKTGKLKETSNTAYLQSRDYLVMDLGHLGGFRSMEVSRIRVEQLLPELEKVEKNGHISKSIKITLIRKGDKQRELIISKKLGQQMYNFITKERKKQANESFCRSNRDGRSGPLICSVDGKRMRDKYATDLFRDLRKEALGDIADLINEAEELEKPGWWLSMDQIIGRPGKNKSALSYHALRHTYLTNLSIENPDDPDYVRQQAGHEESDTTFNIYVDFAVVIEKKKNGHYE